MDLELKDKVAVVGGASKGLGRACAEVLAEEGARVVVCSRTQADLDRTAKEIREATGTDVLALAGDLDNHQTIRDLIAAATSRFGRLDILVNNSGGPPLARALGATEEQWATALQRSLLFFARMSREAIPHMKRHGGGRIINILAATVYQPIPNLALSGVTRLGVVAFAKSLADEVGRDGILVGTRRPRRRDRGGTHRGAPRARAPGGVPGLGKVQLHHGHHHAGRRRARALHHLTAGGARPGSEPREQAANRPPAGQRGRSRDGDEAPRPARS